MAIQEQISKLEAGSASYAEKTTVVGQPDVPGLSTREMQESVEYMPRNLLLPKLNEVVGAVNQCYTKAETDKAIGDKIVEIGAGDMVKAVYDPDKAGLSFTDLRTVMSNVTTLQTNADKLKYVILKLEADGWSDTAPYTQTVSISGMTEDWVPGVPSFIPFFNSDGSVNTTDTVIGLEHAACVKILISSSGTLTAVCPEEKPTWNFSLRVPGMVERS